MRRGDNELDRENEIVTSVSEEEDTRRGKVICVSLHPRTFWYLEVPRVNKGRGRHRLKKVALPAQAPLTASFVK